MIVLVPGIDETVLLTDRLLGGAVMRRESVWACHDDNCDGGWTSLQKASGPFSGPRMHAMRNGMFVEYQ